MKAIITFFVRYPAMVSLGLLITVLAGLISFADVRYTLDPSEKPKEIYVDIVYRGASPLELEDRAIGRIEENLRGIRGMQRFTSVARENSGRITIEISEQADINQVMVDVENAVNRIADFPAQMERPVVHKQELLNPTITLALTGSLEMHQKKDLARRIRDDFMLDLGISNVNLFGFTEEEIVINLREAALLRYGITYQDVARAVQQTNIDLSAGALKLDEANWQIRARNKKNTALDLSEIPLGTGNSESFITLGEVADIREVFADRPAERYLNGRQAVIIQVLTTNDEDLVASAEMVKTYVQRFNEHQNSGESPGAHPNPEHSRELNQHGSDINSTGKHPNDINPPALSHTGTLPNPIVELTVIEDISEFVNDRAAALWENGMAGLILVLLILALFLDKRIAMWVALTIPLSLLGAFIAAMFGYDLTINVVSIFGFILVLGMLVDTGVVVTENIYRHVHEFGKDPITAARDGAAEVASPMVISLLTTVVAFSIFFFLPGKPGAFFSEVSFVVSSALLAALIVTFLFLPARLTRSKVLSANNRPTRLERWFTGLLLGFRDRFFIPFTRMVSFRWRWVNAGVFALLLMLSILTLRTGLLPLTFFPYLDDDIQLIRIELEPGTPADTTMARLQALEESVWRVGASLTELRADKQPVVQFVQRMTGPASHQGQLQIVLLGGEQRGIPAYEINEAFRQAAGAVNGARFVRFMGATAEMRFGGLPVDISVSGDRLTDIQSAAAQLKSELEARNDLIDVADTDQRGNPELHIALNQNGAQLGVTLHEIMGQIRNAWFGQEVQNLQRGGDDVRVWMRFDDQSKSSYHDLARLLIRTSAGVFPLEEIASIAPTTESLEIRRTNGRRTIRVDADLAHPSLSAPAILSDIEANILPGISLKYPDVRFLIEGQSREAGQVTTAMASVAPVLVLIMLALIIINFQSFSQTVIVLVSLPFAFVGVVIGHLIHGVTMNIFSVIGMIALIGILINNMLVLISAFNDNMRSGMNFDDALIDAVQSRFRPILLTSLSTVAGLVPMIFVGGLASAFLQPPAISIAYGLLFGLFISLTLTPAFMVMWNRARLRGLHLIGKTEATSESSEPAVRLRNHQNEIVS
jgi:multidrug efflux pump subunit AcrB